MPDLRETVQTTLRETVTLEHELVGGGMSRVFVAEDKTLGRKIVVKLLPAETAAPGQHRALQARDRGRRAATASPHRATPERRHCQMGCPSTQCRS
ncbi:MAG: hypothetical protein NVSMB53_15840 [Gemmatimonadaceae bacterium]